MNKLLIVDDNKQITSILEDYAKNEGYKTIIALDGEDALVKFEEEKPDIILLDVMMPKKDGFSVCREIRKTSNVPIMMITARGEDFEKIMGPEIVADDYIVKPFSLGEVMARIKAIMRRVENKENKKQCLTFDNLQIDMDTYSAYINNEKLPLTKKEIEILWTLCKAQNKVFSREQLLNMIWGYDYFGDNRTADSHIKRLRAKIDKFEHISWDITTIWGVGYKFEVKENEKK
ncbi:response regulator transcription factor [Anaerofustis sp. NSJ-163]|uniref:response regulator transcription factor n=1 Tax=Anaerofustis sp. NSJ-163 TaxID=2944391 RepID=UPI00209BE6F5|nr:response regulator transcription factor [Anaerofustis sp. NSJ-163]MCO8193581.1 response regulator transcription factor [Anaerofustis sp. NSJ-163]